MEATAWLSSAVWRRSLRPVMIGSLAAGLLVLVPTSGPADTWWAEQNAAHEGCGAGPISAGEIAAPSPAWEGHTYWFQVSPLEDWDCHLCAGSGSYDDFPESAFTCQWQLKRWDAEASPPAWVSVGSLGTDPARSSDWDTDGETPGYYHVKCENIDDTPGDGPGGNDSVAFADSYFPLQWPYPDPESWRIVDCYEGSGAKDGWIISEYEWDASCMEGGGPEARSTHLAHLDNCDGREFVIYPGYPSVNPYYFPEPMLHLRPNPDTKSFTVTSGSIYDQNKRPAAFTPAQYIEEGSSFYATQYMQWKYKTESWDDPQESLAYYPIFREVVYENDEWIYKCTKHEETGDYVIP